MHAVLLYPLYALLAYTFTMLTFFILNTYIPSSPPILGFIARCMSAYLTLVVCSIYGTIASAVLNAFGLHYRYAQWTTGRSFKILTAYTVGVNFRVLDNGRDILNRTRPYVIIVNHQTELDILLLGTIWPQYCSVTAKKSLKNMPFLGWFMTLSGSVFIDRVDRSQALKAFEGAATAMRGLGQSVAIFPEGTRSYSSGPMLLPFKKGAFHLAVQAGAEVLPVVAENYSKVFNIQARRFEAGEIRVKVLDPIPTKGLTNADVDNLTRDTREKMLKALIDLAADTDSKATKAHAS